MYNAEGRGMGVTVLDFDNDGLPDIYVTNDAMPNDLFHNLGGGKFKEEGLEREAAFGEAGQGVSSMGPTFADVDHDGWLDMYIPDMDYGCLLMNRRDHFEDKTTTTGLAVMCGQYTGWGGLFFDYDNDGWLDFLQTSYQAELPVLFRNRGDGTFDDVTVETGAGAGSFPYVKWGVGFVDFDNDGFRDLFILCGHLQDNIELWDDTTSYLCRPVLLRNTGEGKFVNVSDEAGDGLRVEVVGRGAAFEDLDNDGDIDVVILSSRRPAVILRNDSHTGNHWLQIELRGRRG